MAQRNVNNLEKHVLTHQVSDQSFMWRPLACVMGTV